MKYSTDEIIDIAIGIEDKGYEFYNACAERFRDDGLKDTFRFLASQELNHKKIFLDIKQSAERMTGIFTDEYYLYLKSIGGGRIFKDKTAAVDIMKSIHTAGDAIKKAFQDEKESILYYSEMKKLYNENTETFRLIDTIIEEERRHTITLAEIAGNLD